MSVVVRHYLTRHIVAELKLMEYKVKVGAVWTLKRENDKQTERLVCLGWDQAETKKNINRNFSPSLPHE